jgi:hypothetical protein
LVVNPPKPGNSMVRPIFPFFSEIRMVEDLARDAFQLLDML